MTDVPDWLKEQLYGDMTDEELQLMAEMGQNLFHLVGGIANDGDHFYDSLGAAGAQIAQDVQERLKRQ